MKKQLILALGLVAAVAASAQVSTVKEVERGLKSKNDYPKKIATLEQTFNNPETANDAYPYFVAGKYGVEYFDQQNFMSRAGQTVDAKEMGHALIDGYGYLVKALQLDTVTDAKGKVKTKYSKDIVKLVAKAYDMFDPAGIALWGERDFQGAYDAWQLLFEAPANPVLGINAPKAYPDSVLNVIAFNQSLAAYNLENWDATLKAIDNAIALGNNGKNTYDIAIAAASNYPDGERQELMAKYSALAYPLYGAEDDIYLGNVINNMIFKGEYAEAEAAVKQYIAEAPDNAQLYFILGVLYETQEENPQSADLAIAQFEKSISVDPNHDRSLLQLGNLIFNKAAKLDDQAVGMKQDEYDNYKDTQIVPLLNKAAGYFEKAYEINPEDNYSALSNLRSIYYFLNDADNLARIEKLQKGA